MGRAFIFRFFTLYNDNGHFSQFFKPTRGLFQGNPYSCYGFLIMIELFAIMIRKEKRIEGIHLGKMNSLLSLFADDLTLFITNKNRNWNLVQTQISKFERLSGLKVNYDRSVIYRLGSARRSNAMFYSENKMIWSDGNINILGIIVTETDQQMIQKNFDPLFEKIEQIFKIWQARGLSLFGKCLISNTLAASILMYRITVLPLLEPKYYQKYNQLIQDFIWNGKKAKIPLTVLQGNKIEGGCSLFNLRNKDLAFKIGWVPKMLKNPLIGTLAENAIGIQIEDCVEREYTPT